MTAEQEKYIIEKYPSFWDGVFCGSSFVWRPIQTIGEQKTFAKYINFSKNIFALNEKGEIPQLLADKSYTNFKKYNEIFGKVKMYMREGNGMRYRLYFVKPKAYWENFEKYTPFCLAMYCVFRRKFRTENIEKNLNTIIDDALLVYEIVRPDIIYNACLTKDMVLLKDNFNRINQILLKYNKYVYYVSSRMDGFINPTKIEQFRIFINLLKTNKYIKNEKNGHGVVINEKVISTKTFISFCLSFMKELHLYNSRIFRNRACIFFHAQYYQCDKKQKCPRKLQLIFDAVRKYDNEITNQQKTDK